MDNNRNYQVPHSLRVPHMLRVREDTTILAVSGTFYCFVVMVKVIKICIYNCNNLYSYKNYKISRKKCGKTFFHLIFVNSY